MFAIEHYSAINVICYNMDGPRGDVKWNTNKKTSIKFHLYLNLKKDLIYRDWE
jgi:hypothetical protein